MIKIKLFCNAGMSTSMLVNKMNKSIKDKGLDNEIEEVVAYPQSKIEQEAPDASVVLIGPQVKYMMNEVKRICDPKGIPVDVISIQDYGLMKGEAVVEQALKLLGK